MDALPRRVVLFKRSEVLDKVCFIFARKVPQARTAIRTKAAPFLCDYNKK